MDLPKLRGIIDSLEEIYQGEAGEGEKEGMESPEAAVSEGPKKGKLSEYIEQMEKGPGED